MREALNNSYDGWISDEGEQGMETYVNQDQLSNKCGLNTESANTYTEQYSFVSEEEPDYADFAPNVCPCK